MPTLASVLTSNEDVIQRLSRYLKMRTPNNVKVDVAVTAPFISPSVVINPEANPIPVMVLNSISPFGSDLSTTVSDNMGGYTTKIRTRVVKFLRWTNTGTKTLHTVTAGKVLYVTDLVFNTEVATQANIFVGDNTITPPADGTTLDEATSGAFMYRLAPTATATPIVLQFAIPRKFVTSVLVQENTAAGMKYIEMHGWEE